MKRFILLSFAIGSLCLASLASAGPVEVVKRAGDGKELYGTYCSNCHGGTGRGDGPASATLNPRPKPFNPGLKGKKDQELMEVMANGRGQMPGWSNVLDEEQLRAILSHIKELARK